MAGQGGRPFPDRGRIDLRRTNDLGHPGEPLGVRQAPAQLAPSGLAEWEGRGRLADRPGLPGVPDQFVRPGRQIASPVPASDWPRMSSTWRRARSGRRSQQPGRSGWCTGLRMHRYRSRDGRCRHRPVGPLHPRRGLGRRSRSPRRQVTHIRMLPGVLGVQGHRSTPVEADQEETGFTAGTSPRLRPTTALSCSASQSVSTDPS